MVLSRFQGGELRISPSTTSLPVRCLLPMPVPRLIRIMSGVSCVTRMRPQSNASNVTNSSVILARGSTSEQRPHRSTSSSPSTRPCREDPLHLPPGFFIARSILILRSTPTARLTRLLSVPSVLSTRTWVMTLETSPTSPRDSRTLFPLW